MNKKSFIFIALILIIIFCFLKFNLKNVFFNYPKDVEVSYKKMPDLKKERELGFSFLLPKNFILGVKKENLVAYGTMDDAIAFVLKTDRPEVFSGKNGYESCNKILTNKWKPSLFISKYYIVSNWQQLEIKRIRMNNLKGFILSGTKKDKKKDSRYYIYELFDESYGFTVSVKVNKEGDFEEEKINYLVSTIRRTLSK